MTKDEHYADVEKAFEAYADALNRLPKSRHSAIAVTNAETSFLWARAAVDGIVDPDPKGPTT